MKQQVVVWDGTNDWSCGKCYFCGQPTRYWHEKTNTPLCIDCAKTHKSKELQQNEQVVEALKPLKA